VRISLSRFANPIATARSAERVADVDARASAGLPPPVKNFYGRAADLERLRAIYNDRMTQGRTHPARASDARCPILLLIHGKPGVGKTTFALELARRLAREHGYEALYADLRKQASAGTPTGLVAAFLAALGHPAPPNLDLAALRQRFQSLTGSRRVLIVLDSVRCAAEVENLLPDGSRCVVIVVSRRSLAPQLAAASYLLEVLHTDDSWRMLTATAGTDAFEQPESIAEILELCGRLPQAISSVGDQIAQRTVGLRAMAERLRPPDTRLDQVRGAVRESIASDYEGLTDVERRAFRFLSLIEVPTFVSWVLHPLINIEMRETEGIVAGLEAAQLLEIVRPNSESDGENKFGITRYRFHPLFKLYASERLKAEDLDEEIERAQTRLDAACLEMCAHVLAVLEPDLAPMVDALGIPQWIAAASEWPQRIAFSAGDWLQAEYRHLVRAVTEAHRCRRWELCWRLGSYLGDCLPNGTDEVKVFTTLDLAMDAAERHGAIIGGIRVILAKATVLIALERYNEAFLTLQDVEAGCSDLRDSGQSPRADEFQAVVHRKRADAWMQVADYAKSYGETDQAAQLAMAARAELVVDHTRALKRELAVVMGAPTQREDLSRDLSGLWTASLSYRDRLLAAEIARRRRDSRSAEGQLRQLLRQNYGDLRRAASVRYRLARLFLDRWYAEADEAEKAKLPVQAVGFSAAALNNFLEMRNWVGNLRARCILARALCTAKRLDAAESQLKIVQAELNESDTQSHEFLAPLRARFLRALGEYFFWRGSYDEACDRLDQALRLFDELSDYWSYWETLRMLGKAEAGDGDYYAANAAFWQLAANFRKRGDALRVSNALEDLAATALEMNHHATALELHECAENDENRKSRHMSIAMMRRLLSAPRHNRCHGN
jgi:DNA polymerase III delta prime subunit/tetratricopeptide (TPR) repeat protein